MGNKIADFFLARGSETIEKAGDAIDKVVTNNEERVAAFNATRKVLTEFVTETMNSIHQFEQTITERWKADASSDSWLAKNIRPMSFAYTYLLLTAVLFWYVDQDITPGIAQLVKTLSDLLQVMVGAYFGSRGVEKVIRIMRGAETLEKVMDTSTDKIGWLGRLRRSWRKGKE